MNKIMHPIEPEELMAYLDGELPADRTNATAAHLGECAECQGLVSELRNVSQNLKSWKVEPSASALLPAIATALAESRPASRSVFPARRSWREIFSQRRVMVSWLGAAAAICLVVFGAVKFRGGNGNSAVSRSKTTVLLVAPDTAVDAQAQNKEFDRLESFETLQSNPPTRFTLGNRSPKAAHCQSRNPKYLGVGPRH